MSDLKTRVIPIDPTDTESLCFDRGMLYGESIYDVIPFYQNKPYTLYEHYKRFQRDLNLMKISFTTNYEDFSRVIHHAIDQADYTDGALYIQVSAGNSGHRSAMPPADLASTLMVYPFEYPRPTMAGLLAGIKLILFPDTRGAYCHVKSTNRLPTRLAMLHAKEQGAVEAIWHHPKTNIIHEGCTSNIFFIQDHQLITPSLSPYIFPGLVRESILNIADSMKITTICRDIHIDELSHFQGAFITGSTKQLVPIRQLGQHYYSVHPLWGALFKAYNTQLEQTLQSNSE